MHEILATYPVGGHHHIGVQNMWREARQLNTQTLEPKPGDVFVQIKSGGMGHTGFVVGVSADKQFIYTGEGNCGNRVKIGRRSMDSINHFFDCFNDNQGMGGFTASDFDVNVVDAQGTR